MDFPPQWGGAICFPFFYKLLVLLGGGAFLYLKKNRGGILSFSFITYGGGIFANYGRKKGGRFFKEEKVKLDFNIWGGMGGFFVSHALGISRLEKLVDWGPFSFFFFFFPKKKNPPKYMGLMKKTLNPQKGGFSARRKNLENELYFFFQTVWFIKPKFSLSFYGGGLFLWGKKKQGLVFFSWWNLGWRYLWKFFFFFLVFNYFNLVRGIYVFLSYFFIFFLLKIIFLMKKWGAKNIFFPARRMGTNKSHTVGAGNKIFI